MFLSEALPSDLELESILEPSGIQVFLDNPEFLIVDLNRRRSGIYAVRDSVGSRLG